MTDHFDVSTLNWVKGEIDETLKEAQLVLEKYADNPEDEAQLHFCASHLHQVAGTLEMVELSGAAQFAAEMEKLADALPTLTPPEPGLEILTRTLLLLPDYLEVLQNGQPDSPMILLPLLNELRRAHGERELTAAGVFQPSLDVVPPEREKSPGVLAEVAKQLRPRYQAALLNALKGGDLGEATQTMETVLEKLDAVTDHVGLRRWLWAGCALNEALRNGLTLDVPIKLLLGKYDQLIKQLMEGDESALNAGALEALLRATLFEIGKAQSEGPRVVAVREAFKLDVLMPPDPALEKIRAGLGGFNSELKKAVSRDVMEDLSRIKDVLDLFGRSQERSAAGLQPIADSLTHIVEVLGLLRENALGEKLRGQLSLISRTIQDDAVVEESLLMNLAESVLSIESALSDWGAIAPIEKADDAEHDSSVAAMPEAGAEHRRVVRQVMNEAKHDLVKAREAINLYMEKPSDKSLVAEAPRLLRQIAGSLVMLSYRRVAQVLKACQRFVERDLAGSHALPDSEQMDALADAMMSVEYYLEAFVENRVHPSSVLDVAERAVATMGYPVDSLEDDMLPLAAPSDNDAPAPDTYDVVELETGMEAAPKEEVPASQNGGVGSGGACSSPTAADEGDDDEIIAIFIEEAEGEFDKIKELLPRWVANTTDKEALQELRRSFHTLKGSGRLVGAAALGEFAWAFENLLNRVIDLSVAPSAEIVALLQRAEQTLPGLLAEFSHGASPQSETAELQEMANTLANPAAPAPVSPPPPPAEPVKVEIADAALREIYTKEAESHLAQIGAFVAGCRVSRSRISDHLIRALHTLCGGSRTAGVPPIADLAGILEKYARARQASETPIETEALDVLAQSTAFFSGVIRYLRGEQEDLPGSADLYSRAVALLAAAETIDITAESFTESEFLVEESPTFDGTIDAEALPADDAIELSAAFGPGEQIEPGGDEGSLVDEVDELNEQPPTDSNELLLTGLEVEHSSEHQEEEIATGSNAGDEERPSFHHTDEPLVTEGLSEVVEGGIPEENSFEPKPAPEIDEAISAHAPSDLLDVFGNEASDLLSAMKELLQEWKVRPQDRLPVEGLQRLVHTLKGSARWADVLPMADLGHALESTFAAIVAGRLPVDQEVLHLVERAQDCLVSLLSELKGGDRAGGVPELTEELTALVANAEPESALALPSKTRDYDPELLDIFLEEGHEILNASDETLQNWITVPADKRLVETLQRHLHTLKGGARMAGVPEIGDLGHAVESMLAGIVDGIVPTSPRMFSALQRAQDRLAVMLEQLRHHDPVPVGDDIIAEIEALVGGEADSPVAIPAAEHGEADLATPESGPEPVTLKAKVPESMPIEGSEAEGAAGTYERRQGTRAQYELVRVRSDLLDNMVNVAGEASIFRSRVEQQIGMFGFNLSELNQVVERLRDNLRMFDIETEAQIQSRYEEAATQGYEDFDPLEFDRFTHMQQISRSMMESLGDLSSVGASLHNITRETETLLVQQARVNTDLQEGLMHTRMVPLVQNAPRLRRIVRQSCEELGKEAELRFKGAEVEMDRNVVERIMHPLEHLLRNAVAHGIEDPAVRQAKGKPRMGAIIVHQIREGTEIVVRVSDDVAGINVPAVRLKAVARGLMAPDAHLSDEEIMLFILDSGFTTAQSVTQLSGRGVGMDVVGSEVKNLNGSLSIESEMGKGTMFSIRLPMTLSVSRALLVYAGDDMYAIPLLSIEGIVRANEADVAAILAQEEPKYSWLGHDYEVFRLASILAMKGREAELGKGESISILLAHSGEHRVALIVDGLLGSREIVVKPIGRQLGSLRAVSGATILGDGRVALILEMAALIRSGLARRNERHLGGADETPQETNAKPTIMVVDDSITVRKVTSRLLERNDMYAITAKDGIEAVSLLQETSPDVILLDIEMPRMDGYETAIHVRNQSRLRHIPIIMITSRSGEKHRERAMQIGVDIYMTKPFQESDLLESIRTLLPSGNARRAAAGVSGNE